MNPLYNILNGQSNVFQGTPFGNMMNFMNRFNQFRQTFQGDPQQQIQNLLSSGKISQDQYNDAYKKAQQIQQLMNGKMF